MDKPVPLLPSAPEESDSESTMSVMVGESESPVRSAAVLSHHIPGSDVSNS